MSLPTPTNPFRIVSIHVCNVPSHLLTELNVSLIVLRSPTRSIAIGRFCPAKIFRLRAHARGDDSTRREIPCRSQECIPKRHSRIVRLNCPLKTPAH